MPSTSPRRMESSTPDFQSGGSGESPTLGLQIEPCEWSHVKDLIVGVHYAKRAGGRQFCFRLLEGGITVGAVTYGPPSSPQVARSVRIDETPLVELTRLVVITPTKNAASKLVGVSRRLLTVPRIVISYADQGRGHIGYVYQATGFKYAGLVAPHDSEYLIDGERVHPRTLAARGITRPREWARANGIKWVPIEPKHRYWWASGGVTVRWPSLPYPKGESKRYDAPNKDRA